MERFASVPEQLEAKRLLAARSRTAPAHAYLLHGPPGVGGSEPPRWRSQASSGTLAGSRLARIPICTSSSRSGR